ncbi:unnamed protein product [Amoebophrya sp. A25]|nr:unnamed protein product [Amoebophrya sp. A25]|eukprot:GSA25T00012338001.1
MFPPRGTDPFETSLQGLSVLVQGGRDDSSQSSGPRSREAAGNSRDGISSGGSSQITPDDRLERSLRGESQFIAIHSAEVSKQLRSAEQPRPMKSPLPKSSIVSGEKTYNSSASPLQKIKGAATSLEDEVADILSSVASPLRARGSRRNSTVTKAGSARKGKLDTHAPDHGSTFLPPRVSASAASQQLPSDSDLLWLGNGVSPAKPSPIAEGGEGDVVALKTAQSDVATTEDAEHQVHRPPSSATSTRPPAALPATTTSSSTTATPVARSSKWGPGIDPDLQLPTVGTASESDLTGALRGLVLASPPSSGVVSSAKGLEKVAANAGDEEIGHDRSDEDEEDDELALDQAPDRSEEDDTSPKPELQKARTTTPSLDQDNVDLSKSINDYRYGGFRAVNKDAHMNLVRPKGPVSRETVESMVFLSPGNEAGGEIRSKSLLDSLDARIASMLGGHPADTFKEDSPAAKARKLVNREMEKMTGVRGDGGRTRMEEDKEKEEVGVHVDEQSNVFQDGTGTEGDADSPLLKTSSSSKDLFRSFASGVEQVDKEEPTDELALGASRQAPQEDTRKDHDDFGTPRAGDVDALNESITNALAAQELFPSSSTDKPPPLSLNYKEGTRTTNDSINQEELRQKNNFSLECQHDGEEDSLSPKIAASQFSTARRGTPQMVLQMSPEDTASVAHDNVAAEMMDNMMDDLSCYYSATFEPESTTALSSALSVADAKEAEGLDSDKRHVDLNEETGRTASLHPEQQQTKTTSSPGPLAADSSSGQLNQDLQTKEPQQQEQMIEPNLVSMSLDLEPDVRTFLNHCATATAKSHQAGGAFDGSLVMLSKSFERTHDETDMLQALDNMRSISSSRPPEDDVAGDTVGGVDDYIQHSSLHFSDLPLPGDATTTRSHSEDDEKPHSLQQYGSILRKQASSNHDVSTREGELSDHVTPVEKFTSSASTTSSVQSFNRSTSSSRLALPNTRQNKPQPYLPNVLHHQPGVAGGAGAHDSHIDPVTGGPTRYRTVRAPRRAQHEAHADRMRRARSRSDASSGAGSSVASSTQQMRKGAAALRRNNVTGGTGPGTGTGNGRGGLALAGGTNRSTSQAMLLQQSSQSGGQHHRGARNSISTSKAPSPAASTPSSTKTGNYYNSAASTGHSFGGNSTTRSRASSNTRIPVPAPESSLSTASSTASSLIQAANKQGGTKFVSKIRPRGYSTEAAGGGGASLAGRRRIHTGDQHLLNSINNNNFLQQNEMKGQSTTAEPAGAPPPTSSSSSSISASSSGRTVNKAENAQHNVKTISDRETDTTTSTQALPTSTSEVPAMSETKMHRMADAVLAAPGLPEELKDDLLSLLKNSTAPAPQIDGDDAAPGAGFFVAATAEPLHDDAVDSVL